jgi:hypothetical protein
VFIQFQTTRTLHTAALSIAATRHGRTAADPWWSAALTPRGVSSTLCMPRIIMAIIAVHISAPNSEPAPTVPVATRAMAITSIGMQTRDDRGLTDEDAPGPFAAADVDRARTCFQVTVERDQGRKALVARFGVIPLKRQRTATLTDLRPVMASSKRNELIHRLLAECCEICTARRIWKSITSASSQISTGQDSQTDQHGFTWWPCDGAKRS